MKAKKQALKLKLAGAMKANPAGEWQPKFNKALIEYKLMKDKGVKI